MKKMFHYDLVRGLYFHDGLTKREISRRTGLHRKTINKMLLYAQPPGYRLKQPRSKPKLGPFIPIIDEILERDKSVRKKKQRHTAKRIFDRLREEYGFTGGYTIVKDYVREKKLSSKEVYFPLLQRPGTSQTDFGKADVRIAGELVEAKLFCMALPYSDAIFAIAYQTEKIEAVQDGHNAAYSFLGGVPPANLYDNMSTAIKKVFRMRGRDVTDGFLALRSHYLFKSHFCNVGRANEKGVVEGVVGYVRRNFLVPVPSFPSWEALNAYLLECCRKRLSMKAARKEKTIGELLEEERPTFLPLPPAPFEACRVEQRRVSSLSLVRFQSNDYSVPVEYAYRKVTVKGYVDKVLICHKDMAIAEHRRSYERGKYIFDPVHYLPLLGRKPGGLDGSLPFGSWELPKCFETLRRCLEARSGEGGKREYIQVLQLLRDFSMSEVRLAIEKSLEYRSVNFESVKMLTLSAREPAFEAVRLSQDKLAGLPKVQIGERAVSRYQALLAGGVR